MWLVEELLMFLSDEIIDFALYEFSWSMSSTNTKSTTNSLSGQLSTIYWLSTKVKNIDMRRIVKIFLFSIILDRKQNVQKWQYLIYVLNFVTILKMYLIVDRFFF